MYVKISNYMFFRSYSETEVEVPWTATMYVTGDEAIWVEEKCKDHWLWFPNVGKLAKYSRKLKAGMTPYGYGIRLLGS